VLPVLILLIGIAVDYSRIYFSTVTISGSARNGALYEFDPFNVKASNYTSYDTAAQADATDLGGNVSYSKSVSTSASGAKEIAVTVNTEFHTLSSWLVLPHDKNVGRTIVVRQAQLIPDPYP
jgi:hypothetical protein